ncbi:MAG: exodeoxyribonuclease VII small subunit [Lachnospiraceae bacterium]|nr:exodeoxyribonuclease VII small subunit [Lachnospiraceae bacterium]
MKEYKTYESAKKRLEEIASKLEDRELSLDKMIELYEEGARLVGFCYEKLSRAELKLSQISLDDDIEE